MPAEFWDDVNASMASAKTTGPVWPILEGSGWASEAPQSRVVAARTAPGWAIFLAAWKGKFKGRGSPLDCGAAVSDWCALIVRERGSSSGEPATARAPASRAQLRGSAAGALAPKRTGHALLGMQARLQRV